MCVWGVSSHGPWAGPVTTPKLTCQLQAGCRRKWWWLGSGPRGSWCPISHNSSLPAWSPPLTRTQRPRQGRPAYLPPVGAGGMIRAPGAHSLVTPTPQQAGSAPRLPSRANQMPPCPTTVPQPVPPSPPIMWSPESLITNCGPELRVSQSWGSDRGGVMEQVCCEETVLPCQSQGQAGTGVVTVGHGAWEV